MKKILLLFLLILIVCTNGGYSQQTNLSPNLLTFPVSPEAGRLGTFGGVPVNLSSGQISNSVELFTGTVGDYRLPLNLSYSYAGNRMEEEPSIVGLGWQLNMGGVVTKEVRGLPDEMLGFGYFDPITQGILNPYFSSGTINDLNSLAIVNGHLDSEADKYHVSVNGINFSFKIGFNGQPVFLSTHGYKLEIVRGNNPNNVQNTNQKEIVNFILTDTNSNQYHFEQREFTEIVDGNEYFNAPLNYASSWQLSKIILNNGSQIQYNYQNDTYNTKSFSGSLMVSSNGLIPKVDNYSESFATYIINRKLLTSIVSDNFNITLGITTLNNQKVYNTINIKNFLNSNILVYNFYYNEVRNCLTKINKNSQFFYEFEYNSINEPFVVNNASHVKNQDFWGFSNGANNSYFLNGPNNSYYKANRKPNFTTTAEGALIKIKYPTKGYTIINYEQNKVPFLNSESEIQPNMQMHIKFKSDNTYSEPSYKEFYITRTFTTDVVAELSHTISNVNHISVTITGSPSNSCPNSLNYYNQLVGAAVLPKICLNLNDIEQIDGCTLSDCSVSHSSNKKFKIYAGTYTFKISTTKNYLDLNAEILLRYYDPSLPTNALSRSDIGGIRVSSTIDEGINSQPIYNYYDYDDTNSNGSVLLSSQHSHTYGLHPFSVDPPTGGAGFESQYYGTGHPVTNFSKSGFNILTATNAPAFYTKVREAKVINTVFVPAVLSIVNYRGLNWDGTRIFSYAGDVGTLNKSYPEGYKETTFEKPYSIEYDYPYAPSGKDLTGPRESSNSVFSKSDSNYISKVLVSENSDYINLNSTNSDLLNNSNSPKSLKIGYFFDRGNIPITPDRALSTTYKYQTYRENDYEFLKSQINTKEYFNTDVVEKNTAIEYNSHNQQNLITTTETQNTIKTTQIFYPYDFNDAVSQDMVSKNFISPIVKIVNKSNNEIIDSYKYDFASLASNLFKPVYFSTSKNNNPLEKRNLYNYDTKGNIIGTGTITTDSSNPAQIVTTSNMVVIWGYKKTQPICQIENATYNQIASFVANLQTVSDTGTEADLLAALSALRNDPALANSMVTTYTHIPLVGVSTITDQKGDKITYTYDTLGRLEFVKDKNGNILSENQYNYKQ